MSPTAGRLVSVERVHRVNAPFRAFPALTIACVALAVASSGLTPAAAASPISPRVVAGPSALAVIGTIQVGGDPFGLAVSTDDTLYVANQASNSLSVVPPGSLTVGATVPVGSGPYSVAVDRNDDTVYVVNQSSTSVSVVDGRTLTVVDTVGLGTSSAAIAVNSRDDTVYVSTGVNPAQGRLRIVKGRNADDSVALNVGQTPVGVAVHADDDTVYVANSMSSSVSVIKGSTGLVASTISGVPSGPAWLAVNSRDDSLYTSNQGANSISVIDARTGALVSTQSLGSGAIPRVIALSPSDDTLYVADSQGSSFGPWPFHVMNARNLDDSFALSLDSPSVATAVRNDGTVHVSMAVRGIGTSTRVLALARVTPTLITAAGAAGSTATITMNVQGGYAADDTTVKSVSFDDTVATGWTQTGVNTWSGPVPAGAGNVPVTVTFNGGQQALAGNFVYSTDPAPTVTSISPASGSMAGGTPVTITGTNFSTGATVTIGGAACTSPLVVNATTITCTTGARAAGTVNVVVTNPDTQTGTGVSLYTYLQPAPGVSGVAPATGPTAGGTTIAINGTGFLPGASITVGGVACDDTTLVGSTQLTCTTAPGAAGPVNVVVTNPGSAPGTLPNGFTYVDPTPPPSYPPSAPLNVVAIPGNGQATISWSAPNDPGSFPVTSYRVTASPGGRSCVVTVPALTCTITGLTNGVAYTFTVQALNGAGWSPSSAASTAVTPTPGPSPSAWITLDQGTRQPDGTHDRMRTTGDTSGIGAGTLLTPWIRFAGQKDFKQGVASIKVQSDGTFTWTRLVRNSKGLTAYVSWTDITSNRVFWARVR